jgi:hypothetical protein
MSDNTLDERVSAIEAQLQGKTLEEHFREQSQLIDRLFADRFEEFDKKWDARFKPVERDLAVIKDVLKVILTRLP